MASALFGPDGTQQPEPPAVMPDPLLGSGAALDWAPLPALPLALDGEAIRPAVVAAVADEPVDSLETPPFGIPVQSGRPTSHQVASRASPTGAPPPPRPHRSTVPARARRSRAPEPRLEPVFGQTDADPLIRGRRGTSPGGWIGCLVVLISIGAATFGTVESLIDALLKMVR